MSELFIFYFNHLFNDSVYNIISQLSTIGVLHMMYFTTDIENIQRMYVLIIDSIFVCESNKESIDYDVLL